MVVEDEAGEAEAEAEEEPRKILRFSRCLAKPLLQEAVHDPIQIFQEILSRNLTMDGPNNKKHSWRNGLTKPDAIDGFMTAVRKSIP